MNNILLAAEAAANGNNTMSIVSMVALYGGILLVFYFLFLRPQKKRQKAEEEMRNNVAVGDNIVTMGGICGRVVSIKDEDITIETGADRNKITIKKWAIGQNESAKTDK